MNSRFAALALLAFSIHATAQPVAGVLGVEAAKTIRIADAHFHVMSFMAVPTLVEMMDKHGIRWAGGAGFQGETPERRAEVKAALGGRAIDATGLRQWILDVKVKGGLASLEDADHPAFKAALQSMEDDLKAGARVIGEIHVSTLDTAPMPLLRHKIKADAPTLKAMFELATRYKRPLNVHAQWDRETAAGLTRLAESNREGKLIISHCGSTAFASDMRDFLQKNPNAYCDLSFRSPPQLPPRADQHAIFDRFGIRAGWKGLIEEYSDRFFLGTDDVHTWNAYEEVVRNIRTGLLADLSPAAAEKVAYKNAVLLFGLE